MWQVDALCIRPLPPNFTVCEAQPFSWRQGIATWRGSGMLYAHFDP
jgi:hypothetical protein